MEEEIDNHDAKVVDGDGVEISLEDAVEGGWAGETSQDESSSEQGSRDDMDPSWVMVQDEAVPSPWPSPPTSDDEDQALHGTPQKVPKSPSAQSNESGWPSPLKRIQSTLSSIVEATSASLVGGSRSQPHLDTRLPSQISSPSSPRFKTNGGSVPAIQTPTPSPTNSPAKRHHRRTPSSQYPLRGALHPHGSTSSTSGFLNIEPLEQTPPQPVVRRMSSHPDVSSLCDSWASTGPTNQTVNFYKTSPSSSLNSAGLAFTQARPHGSTSTSRSSGQDGRSAHQPQAVRKSISGLFLTPASSRQ